LARGLRRPRQALRATRFLPERLVASWFLPKRLVASWFLPGTKVAQHLESGTSGWHADGAEGWCLT